MAKSTILKQAKVKEAEYNIARKLQYQLIKTEPNLFKRIALIIWHLATFPFVWLWHNLKDWRTILIFIIVFLAISSEVWVTGLIGFIVGADSELGKYLLGIAAACWTWWLLPATPFLPLCITVTMAVKVIFNKIRFRGMKR